MLLREPAHSLLADGGYEVAASPDTPGRASWQWHIRLVDSENAVAPGQDASDVSSSTLSEPLPRSAEHQGRRLEVSTNPEVVRAAVENLIVGMQQTLERHEDELVVLFVAEGRVRIGGRHELTSGDALVSEGDDVPVEIETVDDERSHVIQVRLRRTTDSPLNWVP